MVVGPAVGGLEDGHLREETQGAVLVEGLELLDVLARQHVAEEEHEGDVAVVVAPGDARGLQRRVDRGERLLAEVVAMLASVVRAVAVEAVGPGARQLGAEPPVAEHVLVRHRVQRPELVPPEVAHHPVRLLGPVTIRLGLDEARVLPISELVPARPPAVGRVVLEAVHLRRVGGDPGPVGVVVPHLRGEPVDVRPPLLQRVGAEVVVEGAVLHHQDHHVIDDVRGVAGLLLRLRGVVVVSRRRASGHEGGEAGSAEALEDGATADAGERGQLAAVRVVGHRGLRGVRGARNVERGGSERQREAQSGRRWLRT